jgi:hypothetical protein
MRKSLTTTLLAGLVLCGLSNAATVTPRSPVVSALSINIAGLKLSAEVPIQPARLLPEVYVGNGTHPPGIVHVDENINSSDDALDVPAEQIED